MSPSSARQWLLGHGWSETGRMGNVAALFDRDGDEVLLPLNIESSDFRLRWSELISHLARSDDVDTETILLRIERHAIDVAEFRAGGEALGDNTMPLTDVQALLKAVRQMVAASANAALQPRSHFSHSYPKLVKQHTHSMRMGQTRAGSYVIPIISDVPILRVPRNGELEEAGLFEEVGYVPFARQAMEQLASSLRRLEQFSRNPNLATNQALNESVRDGVSYEMAAGIADALKPESIGQIDVSFSWAQQVRTRSNSFTAVTFSRSAIEPLEAIGEELRNRPVVGEQTLTGYVKSVSREEGESTGKVTIRALVGDEPRLVAMEATDEQCDVAGTVFSQHGYLQVTGVLERESGRQLRFSEITEFRPARTLSTRDQD